MARYEADIDTWGDNSDLTVRFRQIVAPELAANVESDASLSWEEYKWSLYHWKYNRDLGTKGDGNETMLAVNPSLYFFEVDSSSIQD